MTLDKCEFMVAADARMRRITYFDGVITAFYAGEINTTGGVLITEEVVEFWRAERDRFALMSIPDLSQRVLRCYETDAFVRAAVMAYRHKQAVTMASVQRETKS